MIKVLVVDDEAIMRVWLERILEKDSDCTVIKGEASNGREALALCEKFHPQVVLTDIRMPVMDGVELTKQLRNTYPEVITVVLSNYGEYEFVRKTMLNGAFDYILKLETRTEDIMELMERIKLHLLAKEHEQQVWGYLTKEMLSTPHQYPGASQPVQNAIVYMREHYHENISRTEVAEHVHFNSTYFSDVFKREIGVSFMAFLTNIRMEKAKQLLSLTDYSISQIADKIGYFDASYFSKIFRKNIGVSPNTFRQQSGLPIKEEEI